MSRRKKRKSRRTLRALLWHPHTRLIGGLLILAALAWLVRLDFLARSRFEGRRWSLPAEVYARALEVYPGMVHARRLVLAELNRLNYRCRADAGRLPGTCRITPRQILITTRPFVFPDGTAPARTMELNFRGDQLESLRDPATGREETIWRLEPPYIGGIYPARKEDRILVRLEDLPPLLVSGLLAVEDRHYYEHHGVSPKGLGRALLANLKAGRTVQGGSTITQQLVKNFYLTRERSLVRKGNEMLMALMLDFHYDKDEILETYMNEVYFGQSGKKAVHGFGLAAWFYFGKSAAHLNPAEMATLIGMVKGPGYYNPVTRRDRAKKRRDLVLKVMVDQGILTKEEGAREMRRPLKAMRSPGRKDRYPHYLDLVRRQLDMEYSPEDLTSEGLRIFTALDPAMQRRAEKSLTGFIKNRRDPDLQGAMIITRPQDGEVMAVVGDRDPGFAGWNRALDARRQVGSLIKPVVYLTALQRPGRFSLATVLPDEEVELENEQGEMWKPANFDGESHGPVPMIRALIHSYNLATVRLGLELGVDAVAETLHDLGYEGEVNPWPSLFLGAQEMSPMEVATVYQTIASGGFRSPPRAIRAVMTREGETLKAYPFEVRKVVEPATMHLLDFALRKVMQDGTGRSFYWDHDPDVQVAGKTGTSNDLRDSWFAGFSGNFLGVVWLGHDDNRPGQLTGSSGALRVWTGFSKKTGIRSLRGLKSRGVEYQQVDAGSGLLAAGSCEDTLELPFIEGRAPEENAPCAGTVERIGDWIQGLFGEKNHEKD